MTKITNDHYIKPEYEYHWGRIIAALALIALGLGGLIYSLDSSEPANPEAREVEVVIAPPGSTAAPSTAPDPAPEATHATPAPDSTQVEPTPSVPAPASKATSLAIQAAPAANKDIATPEPAKGVLRIRGIKTRIHDKRVEQFVFANEIKDLKPVGKLDSTQGIKPGNRSVSVFSAVNGLKQKSLRYEWKRNGEALSPMKVVVKSSNWRSFSNKLVTRKMTGNWQVRLFEGKTLLAEGRFEVVAP